MLQRLKTILCGAFFALVVACGGGEVNPSHMNQLTSSEDASIYRAQTALRHGSILQCWYRARDAQSEFQPVQQRYVAVGSLLRALDELNYICGVSRYDNRQQYEKLKGKLKSAVVTGSLSFVNSRFSSCELNTFLLLLKEVEAASGEGECR